MIDRTHLIEPIANHSLTDHGADPAGVPIILHLGPHKTGSTWLQESVFPKLTGVTVCADRRIIRPAFLNPSYGNFSPVAAREAFDRHLDQAQKQGHALIITDEALSGRAIRQKYVREITAYRLRAAFPEAKVMFFCREQISLLASLYGEYIRFGHSSSIEYFLHPGNDLFQPIVDLSYYDWARTRQIYAGCFGEDNVISFPLELAVREPATLLQMINRHTGGLVNAPEGIDGARRVRPALSGWARSVQRRMNGFIPQDSRGLRERGFINPGSVAYWVDRMTPPARKRRQAERERALIQERVGDMFSASNRRFSDSIGVDLGQFGYQIQ